MNFNTGALAASAAINMAEQERILNHIKKHPERQAQLAIKEYKRFKLITFLIILLVIVFFLIYFTSSFIKYKNPEYPTGATKQTSGHISLYEDTFWYTDSSQKYEFDFEDYNIDESFEPGENIIIYLDDNNDVVSVAHNTEDYEFLINIILIFVIPIAILLVHAFVGRKAYAKNWNLYVQWYEKEIEPYCFQPNFEEIIANKQYYDVTVNFKDLSEEKQRLYKKYRNKKVLYSLLYVGCIVLTLYFVIKFNLNPYSWLVVGIVIIYTIVFYFLINDCDAEMHRIKTGYYDKK